MQIIVVSFTGVGNMFALSPSVTECRCLAHRAALGIYYHFTLAIFADEMLDEMAVGG